MSDTTVAAPAALGAPPRRPRPTWGLHEGDELAPGRTVLRRIGGGRRYEAMLVWDEHRLAVLVAKVLRPDQATRAGRAARPRARGRAARRGSRTRWSCAASAPCWTAASRTCVLEHLEGPTLDELLDAHGPLALEQLLPLGLHVASALHYLAAEGVVHLDVKPSNIVMGAPAAADRPQRRAHARRRPPRCAARSAPTPTWRRSSARPTAAGRPARRRLRARRDALHAALTGAPAAAPRADRCPAAAPRARAPLPRRTPRALAELVRAGLDPDPAARPAAARVRRGARAARRRAAAPADARPPLVTSCGGWPAATPSPPER